MFLADTMYFFSGGAILTNAVPHVAAGLMGQRFHTVFAKRFAGGMSSPRVNVMWGFALLALAYQDLVVETNAFDIRSSSCMVPFSLGAIIWGFLRAHSLGRILGNNSPSDI